MTDTPQRTEKDRLLDQKRALGERLEAIRRDIRNGLDADSEERAVQLENAEVLAGIARATAEELVRVEQRLAELD